MKKVQQQKPISALAANLATQNNLHLNESDIQYQNATQENPFELSDDEKEREFQTMHQEYLTEKLNRKKQQEKVKRENFGSSSSEEDDVGGSQSSSLSEKRISNLEEERQFRESDKFREMKAQQEEKMMIFSLIKKPKDLWIQNTLELENQSLMIGEKTIFLKEFHKIKISSDRVIENCSKIKLSTLDQEQILIAASSKKYLGLPLNYYIFAFVIQQKLLNMGQKLPKYESPAIPGIPETVIKNSLIYGKIFKKSQILGKWEERLIVINKEGIFSYKRFNEKHSMFISGSSLKEIWTRFEIEEKLLVVKILHSNSTKTEFGIPLSEMLDRRCWLFSFYDLAFMQK